jgi:hypothetical protein
MFKLRGLKKMFDWKSWEKKFSGVDISHNGSKTIRFKNWTNKLDGWFESSDGLIWNASSDMWAIAKFDKDEWEKEFAYGRLISYKDSQPMVFRRWVDDDNMFETEDGETWYANSGDWNVVLGNQKQTETAGVRQNQGKPMLSPVDPALLLEMGKGLEIGQTKYKDKAFNKEGNVMLLSTGYDSLMRHLLKFMSGEDVDPDDGVHHLAKVINCTAIMWHNRLKGDDRKKKGEGE